MRLTDTAIRAAKAGDKPCSPTDGDKPCSPTDGGGLYLLVNPTGSRLWRLKYRIEGKEKLLAIGPYPDVTLAMARCAVRLLDEGAEQAVHTLPPSFRSDVRGGRAARLGLKPIGRVSGAIAFCVP